MLQDMDRDALSQPLLEIGGCGRVGGDQGAELVWECADLPVEREAGSVSGALS